MLGQISYSQVTIYSEDFTGQNGKGAKGTGTGGSPISLDTSGVDWSVDTTNVTLTASTDYLQVVNEAFEFQDLDGFGLWKSPIFDIQNLGSLTLSIDLAETGSMTAADTIAIYLNVDNGVDQLFYFEFGDFTSKSLVDTPISVSGVNLQIVVLATNNTGTKQHTFDNVVVKGVCGSSPVNPTSISYSPTIGTSAITWTNPACYDEILLVCKAASTISGIPSGDGTAYTSDPSFAGSGTAFDGGKVVYKGIGTSVSITNLSSGTTYYAKLWTRVGTNWSSGAEISIGSTYIPNLLISEIADPSDNTGARFVELYNTDSVKINFTSTPFYICKETNGGGSFSCRQLTGTLNPGKNYTVAVNGTDYTSAYSKTANDSYGSFTGNGNDGYFLYANGDNTSGTLWDAYGVIGQDGTGQSWEYTDSRAVRKPTIETVKSTWDAAEWTITSATASACEPDEHTSDFPNLNLSKSQSLLEGVYNTLTINGINAIVTATGPIVIINQLKLKNGLLNLDGHKLFLGLPTGDATISDANSTSYIYGGEVRSYINSSTGTYRFELGTEGTEYSPFTVQFNSSTLGINAYIDATVQNTAHPNLPGHVQNYIERNWNIEANAITNPNYDISLNYTDADIVGDENTFLPVKYSGSTWTAPGSVGNSNVDTTGIGSVDVASNTLTWTKVDGFSIYTAVGDGSPLPVELLSFKALQNEYGNLIKWTTSSEINSATFLLERKTGDEDFKVINQQKGAGSSNSEVDYSYEDRIKSSSETYYRLNQIDFDGSNKYSRVISVRNQTINEENSTINVMVNENSIQLSNLEGLYDIQLIDISGKVVFTSQVEIDQQFEFSSDRFKSGIYNLVISNTNGASSQRSIFLGK